MISTQFFFLADGINLPEGNSCGLATDTGFIVGGQDAKRGAYPFVALLAARVGNQTIYHCGGALISRRYVITAAHCQRSEAPISEVVLGEHNIDLDPECDQNQNRCHTVQRFNISLEDVTVHEG
jgi:secreted trypsin-like serine protease